MEEKNPTNEEIIEEITEGLEKSAIKSDSLDEEKFFDVYGGQDSKAEKFIKAEEVELPIVSESDQDAYFIEEAAIKARDATLNNEELEDFKKQSDELKAKGNKLFQSSVYEEATGAYTEALQICPLKFEKERAILYANRAAARAKFMLEKSSAISDCTKAIELDPKYVKCILRRARYYEDDTKLDEALADYKKIQEIDPANKEVIHNINRLTVLVNERNEKMKEEMLGKLKDLGNLFLKPFGLSTNNFQMEKDEASGGYSVKFNQNPT